MSGDKFAGVGRQFDGIATVADRFFLKIRDGSTLGLPEKKGVTTR